MTMVNDPDALAEMLAAGPLAGRPVYAIDLPRSGERVLTIPLEPRSLMDDWVAARALLPRTGRWPVAATSWGSGESDQPGGRRWLRRGRPAQRDPSPTLETLWLDPGGAKPTPPELRDEAARLDGGQALAELRAAQQEDVAPIGEFADWLEDTQQRIGEAPTFDDVQAEFADGEGQLTYRWLGKRTPGRPAVVDLERWLFDWEEAHSPTAAREHTDYDDWYEPDATDTTHLLFLPTASSADTLAYIEFYAEDGVAGATTARLIAILRSWNERYGAELIAHWGTMLQFRLTHPPTSLEEAWKAAVEIDLVAPCTNALPGETIRGSARTLWRRPTWFLHERP